MSPRLLLRCQHIISSICISSLFLCIHRVVSSPFADCIDKPVLPASVPEPYTFDTANGGVAKLIPQHMWIAVRNVSDGRPGHLPGFLKKNGNWTVHFQGNTEKDAFMETIFANTSTLWAYHVLNPAIGTAKVELWPVFSNSTLLLQAPAVT